MLHVLCGIPKYFTQYFLFFLFCSPVRPVSFHSPQKPSLSRKEMLPSGIHGRRVPFCCLKGLSFLHICPCNCQKEAGPKLKYLLAQGDWCPAVELPSYCYYQCLYWFSATAACVLWSRTQGLVFCSSQQAKCVKVSYSCPSFSFLHKFFHRVFF